MSTVCFGPETSVRVVSSVPGEDVRGTASVSVGVKFRQREGNVEVFKTHFGTG